VRVVLDGTLTPIDLVAADRPFYSGKHRRHRMNLQVIASPDGDIIWVSGALPGSVHDKKAESIWGVLDELEAAGLITLADKGHQGAAHAKPLREEEQARVPETGQPPTRETPLTRTTVPPAGTADTAAPIDVYAALW
jgi:DDE superfamily endonuclease